MGTIRTITDGSGAFAQACTSLPFGDDQACTPSISDPSPQHFTGKPRDAETGLDNFGARYYSAAGNGPSDFGRFMTPDWSAQAEPVPYAKLDNPQSLDLYSYVLNNPVTGADADGHDGDPSASDVLFELSAGSYAVAAVSAAASIGVVDAPVTVPSAVGAAAVGTVFGIAGAVVRVGEIVTASIYRSDGSATTAPEPAINEQKQAGHVRGTPQYENRVKQGKKTSAFDSREEADRLTWDTYNTGTAGDKANQIVKEYNRPVGTGAYGGTQSQVRVHVDGKGQIHGHPDGEETPTQQ